MVTEGPAESVDEAADGLRASARGWHGIQLAVLGFIGLCGVLQQDRALPLAVELVAAVLALLALACLATVLIGMVAWPLGQTAGNAERRLRAGIVLTFVAVATVALSAAAGWWPSTEPAAGLVEASDAAGRTWCGRFAETGSGGLTLIVDGDELTLPLRALTHVRPVGAC
ncbi:hypothetical protein [Pseudonocardia nigra]|uniref:hypothetical protein n=1 Tax=Pseudonocardia nigra TaxID=1921578 RepID=UPI001C5D79E2|nr:hypothetical protein [Pseudonocardia nigra]